MNRKMITKCGGMIMFFLVALMTLSSCGNGEKPRVRDKFAGTVWMARVDEDYLMYDRGVRYMVLRFDNNGRYGYYEADGLGVIINIDETGEYIDDEKYVICVNEAGGKNYFYKEVGMGSLLTGNLRFYKQL